jgi:predicted metal-binding membrane protein
MSHWHGRRAHAEALGTGWWHGLYCVGCCWALMLLMFAMGTLSLTAMLLLALVMAAEKNAPWGQRLGRPLGVALLGLAAGLGLYQLAA